MCMRVEVVVKLRASKLPRLCDHCFALTALVFQKIAKRLLYSSISLSAKHLWIYSPLHTETLARHSQTASIRKQVGKHDQNNFHHDIELLDFWRNHQKLPKNPDLLDTFSA